VGSVEVYRRAAPKVRQSERGSAVTTVEGAKQAVQGLILIDGQYLSIASRPATRREIKTDHANFC
jgi:hypothetical protein